MVQPSLSFTIDNALNNAEAPLDPASALNAFLKAAALTPRGAGPAPLPYPQAVQPAPTPAPRTADQDIPAWYQPEQPNPPPARPPQGATGAQYPAWLQEMDTQAKPSAPDNETPDWYTPEGSAAPQPGAVAAPPQQAPDWYTPDAPAAAPAAQPAVSDPVVQNVATGLGRVPGAILGLPRAASHAADWLIAKGINAIGGTNLSADDVDKYNLNHYTTPKASTIDKAVFGVTGTTPYQPTTPQGEIGQAAVTAAGAGLLDPAADAGAISTIWNLVKSGAAGGAGELAHQTYPKSDVAPILASLFAHNGAGLAGDMARTGYATAVRPLFRPAEAGSDSAGAALSAIDNAQPGLANPTPAALTGASGDVRAATDSVGTGTPAAIAVGDMRDALQNRWDGIKANAAATAKPLYDAFRAQPPVAPDDLAPLNDIPAIKPAMDAAATDMANSSQAGNPWNSSISDGSMIGPNGLPVAIPAGSVAPDLLDRTRMKLNDQAAQARLGSDGQRAAGLSAAGGTLTNFLDQQFPGTYPQARQAYADAMQPAAPFNEPAVSRAMNRAPAQYGYQPEYNTPAADLFDNISRSKDPGAVVGQFVKAAGGDKDAIVQPLQEALVDRLRSKGVIDPTTGEIDPKAYAQEIRPYMPTVSMYMPELAKKFATAQAAQGTLDTMRVQAGLASDIAQGGLRDDGGVVTGRSFSQWVNGNRKALEQSQSPAAVMRLQQIGKALGGEPGQGAQAIADDVLPAVIGTGIGGVELGILGHMTGQSLAKMMVGPRLARYRDAYSSAIERAVTDPIYAQRIIRDAAKRPSNLNSVQAIRQAIGKRALQSVLPTNAVGQQLRQ